MYESPAFIHPGNPLIKVNQANTFLKAFEEKRVPFDPRCIFFAFQLFEVRLRKALSDMPRIFRFPLEPLGAANPLKFKQILLFPKFRVQFSRFEKSLLGHISCLHISTAQLLAPVVRVARTKEQTSLL